MQLSNSTPVVFGDLLIFLKSRSLQSIADACPRAVAHAGTTDIAGVKNLLLVRSPTAKRGIKTAELVQTDDLAIGKVIHYHILQCDDDPADVRFGQGREFFYLFGKVIYR